MANKLQYVSQLADQTAKAVTRNAHGWKSYLTTASRLYKDVCCKRWKEDFTQYSIAAGSFVVKPTICRF